MALPGSMATEVKDEVSSNGRQDRVNPDRSLLLDGFAPAPSSSSKSHPLEQSERSYAARMDAMHMGILKQTQGMHAPLRLMMERDAASRVGRLPFLTSSHLMTDVLRGRDEDIGPEDLFNDAGEPETRGTPHMVMERSLNLV